MSMSKFYAGGLFSLILLISLLMRFCNTHNSSLKGRVLPNVHTKNEVGIFPSIPDNANKYEIKKEEGNAFIDTLEHPKEENLSKNKVTHSSKKESGQIRSVERNSLEKQKQIKISGIGGTEQGQSHSDAYGNKKQKKQ